MRFAPKTGIGWNLILCCLGALAAAIETARVFCATVTLPRKGLLLWLLPATDGSLYVNVPGVANVHEPLWDGCRLSLQFVLATATA